MQNKLMMIRERLSQISTKGEDTIVMADCLLFINQCIVECQVETNKKKETEEDYAPKSEAMTE